MNYLRHRPTIHFGFGDQDESMSQNGRRDLLNVFVGAVATSGEQGSGASALHQINGCAVTGPHCNVCMYPAAPRQVDDVLDQLGRYMDVSEIPLHFEQLLGSTTWFGECHGVGPSAGSLAISICRTGLLRIAE